MLTKVFIFYHSFFWRPMRELDPVKWVLQTHLYANIRYPTASATFQMFRKAPARTSTPPTRKSLGFVRLNDSSASLT